MSGKRSAQSICAENNDKPLRDTDIKWTFYHSEKGSFHNIILKNLKYRKSATWAVLRKTKVSYLSSEKSNTRRMPHIKGEENLSKHNISKNKWSTSKHKRSSKLLTVYIIETLKIYLWVQVVRLCSVAYWIELVHTAYLFLEKAMTKGTS